MHRDLRIFGVAAAMLAFVAAAHAGSLGPIVPPIGDPPRPPGGGPPFPPGGGHPPGPPGIPPWGPPGGGGHPPGWGGGGWPPGGGGNGWGPSFGGCVGCSYMGDYQTNSFPVRRPAPPKRFQGEWRNGWWYY